MVFPEPVGPVTKIIPLGFFKLSSSCFKDLHFPPIRIGMPDYPTPSSRGYLKSHYPDKIKIIDAASKFFNILRKNRKKVLKEILKETENIPKDIPHPSFKGPF